MAAKNVARPRHRNDWSAEELRERLDYYPETGEFWTRPRKVGHVATYNNGRRAVTIYLQSKAGKPAQYYAHRLAWLWMTGSWPVEIDHINNDSTDNRWSNLREATRAQNIYNRGRVTYNTSGYTGAFYYDYKDGKRVKRWKAMIQNQCLGYFATAEEAHEAYKREAAKRYGEFAHSSLITPPSTPLHREPESAEDRQRRQRRGVPTKKAEA